MSESRGSVPPASLTLDALSVLWGNPRNREYLEYLSRCTAGDIRALMKTDFNPCGFVPVEVWDALKSIGGFEAGIRATIRDSRHRYLLPNKYHPDWFLCPLHTGHHRP